MIFRWMKAYNFSRFCQTPGLGVDITFTQDNKNKNKNNNNNNNKNNNNNTHNNPHLNFLKGTVVGDQG